MNIRILREFTRYRYKRAFMKSSEKNRFQNCFTVCNVALDSVVSDMFGVSATAITDYLISTDDFDEQHCRSLLKRSMKKKADEVIESIKGYSIEDEQKHRMKFVRSQLDFIENEISLVDLVINSMVLKYESLIFCFALFRVFVVNPLLLSFLKYEMIFLSSVPQSVYVVGRD